MAVEIRSAIYTLSDVFNMMSPFAGGSIPDSADTEYADWLRWVQQAQEEYARRGFWRRLLTRDTITLNGETTLLPERFHKQNGLYMLVVDGVDWMDADNEDDQYVLVEMDNDPFTTGTTPNTNLGRWQMRFKDAPVNKTATIWYFANPPKPMVSADVLILPGDMIGYKALGEYYRTSGAEGSQDKAESDAENRFQEYLMLESIPGKNELIRFDRANTKTNELEKAKNYYRSRPYRSRSTSR